ncbi:MAG: DNA topoisomerase III [Chthoniobacteraceae bacterium]|nr:DNA topoisomerase III [Chthoniobacteraceae bacterium]
MGKTLVIAEKPSVAGDIAKVLGKFKKEGDFYENEQYVIASAIGHLLELCVPEGLEPKRGKWDIKNLPILPQTFELAPTDGKAETRFKLLKRLMKREDVEGVINACDAGREGELIFRNLIQQAKCKKPIQRLWLQSMTADAIRTAFRNLRSDSEMQPLAAAAVCRSESDWLVGINATRSMTWFNSKQGGFRLTTAGRVQTPTLAILVEREERIRAFKPRPYFEVHGRFGVQAGEYAGRWYDEHFKKADDETLKAERIWTREEAEALRAKCEGKPGIVTEEKKSTSQIAPQLYDLTTLQREANGRFGFSAKTTLQIAQALYERHKALTYPRTDSRYLPDDYLANVKNVMADFPEPTLAPHAKKALSNGWIHPNRRIFNSAKVTDHNAIIPTGVEPKTLSEAEAKIFRLVSQRFIAVFFPAAQFEVTTRITRVEGEPFKTEGKIIKDPGWMAVYGKEAATEEGGASIVPVLPGEQAETLGIDIKESETKPPARFNEATLLSAMEGAGKLVDDEDLREAMSARGLGTPATRAAVIEGLVYQEYILRQGRELMATQKGISLITGLRGIGVETLTRPEMTGEWEFKLKQMEQSQLPREEFMRQIRELTVQIVEKIRNGGEPPEGAFENLDATCPKCGAHPLKQDYRTYRCTQCDYVFWKTLAGREFSPEEVQTLLRERKIGPLEGFRSKMGRAFKAALLLDEEHKAKFEFEKKEEEAAPADWNALPLVGECPVCKKASVRATETAYLCERTPAHECTFRMGRQILKRDIPIEQARKLVETGKTDLITKFVSSKTNRPFDAFLKLEKGKVGFEFPPREAKPGAKGGGRGRFAKRAAAPAKAEGAA